MPRHIVSLQNCSEFRQTLEARPPALLHATAALAMAAIGVALVWAALTPATLVVRSTGRVRPVAQTAPVFAPATTKADLRIARVLHREGDRVARGAPLAVLDTQRLENDVARLTRTIATTDAELAKLDELAERLTTQFVAAEAKAQAELEQATREIERTKTLRESEARRMEAEVTAARDRHERNLKLATTHAVTAATVVDGESKLRESEEKLATARLPVDESKRAVFERALALVGEDHQVKLAELDARRVAKRGERATAEKDLANLTLELEQATLRAPIDGVVTKGRYRVGDRIEPGKAAFELAADDAYCFEAAVVSEDVGRLRQHMKARVKFDAFDFQRYGTLAGEVSFISPDSTLLTEPAGRGTVYVVRVRLTGRELRRGELRGAIKLGMAGTVEIVTDRQSVLMVLVRRIRSSISLG